MALRLPTWFLRAFPQYAPTPPPTFPSDPPPVTPPARVITGDILDITGWTDSEGINSEWEHDGSSVTYLGMRHADLRSEPILVNSPGETVRLSVTVAGQKNGPWMARGRAFINAYRADGRSLGSSRVTPINAGTSDAVLEMPADTRYYVLRLMPLNTYKTGTSWGGPGPMPEDHLLRTEFTDVELEVTP